MKKLLFILILTSFCLASTNFASRVTVDGAYEIVAFNSKSVPNKQLFGDTTAGLDTLDGADSVKIFNDFTPVFPWEYILTNSAISGDSATNGLLTLVISAIDKNDSTISHVICDTLTNTGCSILIPFRRTYGYIAAVKYDMWLKAPDANDEIDIKRLYFNMRRLRQMQTIK